MAMKQSVPSIVRVALFASACLWSVKDAAAARDTIDPFSFCVESCKPSLCEGNNPLKAQCQKMCDGIWKQVASLQMSRDNKEFRMEKVGSPKKESMLYQSPVAQCLEKKEPPKEAEKEKEAVKELAKAGKPNVAPHNTNAAHNGLGNVAGAGSVSDLCKAAIKKEMEDLKADTGALATQTHNLEKALEKIEAAK